MPFLLGNLFQNRASYGWAVSLKSSFHYRKTMICDDVVSQRSISKTLKVYVESMLENLMGKPWRNTSKCTPTRTKIHVISLKV